MRGVAVARILVVVVAVPVIVWLAVSWNDARLLWNGNVVVADPHASHARIEAALRDVRGAHRWADATVALSVEAALEIRAGRRDAARALYEQIVRREPDSADGWVVLEDLTRKSDPARSAQARAQVRRLDPLQTARH